MARKIHHRTTVEELDIEIMAELRAYSDEVSDEIKENVKRVAKECVRDIKRKAPKDSGDYQKGWKSKTEFENKNDIRVRIYNSKAPQLTHLLEFGHIKNDGGRVEGIPHIYPARKAAEEKLMERAKVSVKR